MKKMKLIPKKYLIYDKQDFQSEFIEKQIF